jgi:hypothetical protein
LKGVHLISFACHPAFFFSIRLRSRMSAGSRIRRSLCSLVRDDGEFIRIYFKLFSSN